MKNAQNEVNNGKASSRVFAYEDVCIKFVAEVVDVARRVRANREAAKLNKPAPDYFIHQSGLEDLLKRAQDNLRIYLGVSVGQYYHEKEYVEAQIACLQRFREAFEKYLQSVINNYTNTSDKPIKFRWNWPVEKIIADSPQVLNEIPRVELNYFVDTAQCVQLLHQDDDEKCTKEKQYIEQGIETEKIYSDLLRYSEQRHQRNVVINFTLASGTLRWSNLKKCYSDPDFIEMLNHLEKCFKDGYKAIQAKKQNGKFNDLSKDLRSRLGEDWATVVSVNDLAYLSEIIMVNYVILNPEMQGKTKEQAVFMYPQQLNILLGAGRNLLRERFGQKIAPLPFVSLWVDNINIRNTLPKEGELLFSNRSCEGSLGKAADFIGDKIEKKQLLSILSLMISSENDVYPPPRESKWLSVLRAPGYKRYGVNDTLESTNLEFTARALLTFSQMTYGQSLLRAIFLRSPTNRLSAITTAFCSALNEDNIAGHLEGISSNYQFTDDFGYFKEAWAQIQTHIYKPFTDFSSNMRASNANKLLMYCENTESHTSKLLIAARLEVLLPSSGSSLAIYLDLLFKNFAPYVQFANILRIGRESLDALYAIGLFIIENNFSDIRLYDLLMNFIKHAIDYFSSSISSSGENQFIENFRNATKPDWTEIALACIELACYNSVASHTKAKIYLSKIYMNGLKGYVPESTKMACLTLIHASKPDLENFPEIEALDEFKNQKGHDIWIIHTFGNFMMQMLKNPEYFLEIAQSTCELFEVNHMLVLQDRHNNDNRIIKKKLRENAFLLAMMIVGHIESRQYNPNDTQILLKKVNAMLYVSANLGHLYSKFIMSGGRSTRAKRLLSNNNAKSISIFYQRTLSSAMIDMSNNKFEFIIAEFQQFVKHFLPSDQNIIARFRLRFNALLSNFKYLQRMNSTSTFAYVREWCGSFFFAGNRAETSAKLLIDLGFTNDNPQFKYVIMLMTDYYILSKHHKGAGILFQQFQDDLSEFTGITEGNRHEISILVNFYINVIENQPEACEEYIRQSPKICKTAFLYMAKRMLLPQQVRISLQELFKTLDQEISVDKIDEPKELKSLI